VSLLARFSAEAMLDMLRRDRLTIMCGVPTMWNAMLHSAGDATADDFAQLRLAVSGGASLPAEVARAFQEKFGCTLLEGYGLTETTAVATFSGATAPPGTVGQAVFDTEVQIRDQDGRAVGRNTAGEVYIKGPTVMRGYHRDPAATAATVRDGWLHTGDLGRRDGDGYFFVTGRAKDLIITGGENVSPAEVEAVLRAHPDVADVAVIGTSHPRWGEQVTAVVVRRDGATLDGEALGAFAGARLAGFKRPRRIEFVASLPRNAYNKVQTHLLRRELEGT